MLRKKPFPSRSWCVTLCEQLWPHKLLNITSFSFSLAALRMVQDHGSPWCSDYLTSWNPQSLCTTSVPHKIPESRGNLGFLQGFFHGEWSPPKIPIALTGASSWVLARNIPWIPWIRVFGTSLLCCAFFSGTPLLYPGQNLSQRTEEVGLWNQVSFCFKMPQMLPLFMKLV